MFHDIGIRTILGAFAVVFIVGIVLFLAINANSPVAVSKQVFNNPNGTTTSNIVSTCQSFPNIFGNPACKISSNIQTNIQPSNPACANGGTPTQTGQCPTNVIPLQQIPIMNTTQTVAVKPSEQISMTPIVTFSDSSGNSINVQTNTILLNLNSLLGFKSLAFVTDKNTQIDLNNGYINLQIQIKASPNEHIVANGTMFVKLNSQQLHQNGVPWAINGNTDPSGVIYANIVTPVGFSDKYVFSIGANFNTISSNPVNVLNFTMAAISIQGGNGLLYRGTAVSSFFNTEIDYDGNKVLEKNNQGQYVRIFPSDDTFTIASNPIGTPSSYYVPCQKGGTYIGDHQVGCGSYSTTIYSPAVPAGSAAVYLEPTSTPDGTEKLLGTTSSITSGNSATVSNIPRDADIKVVITGGTSPSTKTYHTPQTQQSYGFICGSSCSFSP